MIPELSSDPAVRERELIWLLLRERARSRRPIALFAG